MIYLIDKKLMPGNGIFRFQVLDPNEFIGVIGTALEREALDCRIMDIEIVDVLKAITKLDIPVCPIVKGGNEITLETGDAVLSAHVMKVEPFTDPVAGMQQPATATINVIMATHYDFTPEGLVMCVKDAQIVAKHQSEIPRRKWYTQFRDTLTAEISVEDETDAAAQKNVVQIV